MNKKTIEDINVQGKRVLVRCDFNVPLDENRSITNENRIVGSLPTIEYLIRHGAKVILCSHLGRPKGEVNPKFSLDVVARRLSELLLKPVLLGGDIVGPETKSIISNMNDGDVILLENVRFFKEETSNDVEFSKSLSELADLYVNDAFGTAHRAHSSTTGVAEYLPAVSGYLIQKELKFLGDALDNPTRPFVAILGGAKVDDKISVIMALLKKVDTLIIGGGMSYTFLKAQGYGIGTSLLAEEKIDVTKEIMQTAKDNGVKLLLPVDIVVGKEFDANTEYKVVDIDSIPEDWMGLDIGPKTVEIFKDAIMNANTVVWNGPMGVFEFENFANGTKSIADAMANSSATTVIGGGDSAAAATQMGYADRITHVSTGGGASLEYLEGKVLPGIAALNDIETANV